MNIIKVKEAYARRKPKKVNVYSMFPGTFESPDRQECQNFNDFRRFLQSIDELKKTMKIEWKSFDELVEIFKAREEAETLDFSDIDVDNILRSPWEREYWVD